MGKVGRPKKLDDQYIKQLAIIYGTNDRRMLYNYHYLVQTVKVLILDKPNIPHLEILFNSKTQKYNSQSSLVELGRLYDLIETMEGQEVATNFIIEYTNNILEFTNDNKLKSKQLEQCIRDKKQEIKELYK